MRFVVCDNPKCDNQEDLRDLENRFFNGTVDPNEANWMQFDDLELCPDCSTQYKTNMKEATQVWRTSRAKVLDELIGSDTNKESKVSKVEGNIFKLFGGEPEDDGS